VSKQSGKGSAITTPSEVYKRWAIMIHRREGDRHSSQTWLSAPPQADRGSGAVWTPSKQRREAAAAQIDPMAITECLARTASEPPEPAPQPTPQPVVEPEPEPELLPQPAIPYESWTRAALYAKAKEVEIPGRSSMTKGMLAQKLWARTAA